MKIIGNYSYGSRVNGTYTEISDFDSGSVVFSGPGTIIDLNKTRRQPNTNNVKKEDGDDKEQLELITWCRNLYAPSLNMLEKVYTFKFSDEVGNYSPSLFSYLISQNFMWKPYLFRCASYAENCKTSAKGIRQATLALDTCKFQYENRQFLVDPAFWVNQKIPISFFMDQYRNFDLEHDTQTLEEYQRDCTRRILELRTLAENEPFDKAQRDRRETTIVEFLFSMMKSLPV